MSVVSAAPLVYNHEVTPGGEMKEPASELPPPALASGADEIEDDQWPPAPPDRWSWFAAYCSGMGALCFFCWLAGVIFLTADADLVAFNPDEARSMGIWLVLSCTPLTLMFASAPFLPRKPWAWRFGLFLIALGLLTVCCLPLAVPLLMGWLRQDIRGWYSRDGEDVQPGAPDSLTAAQS